MEPNIACTLSIRTVTIIGANGTQGCNLAGIFASFGNAKVYMGCRELGKAIKAKERAVKTVRAEAISPNLIPIDYSSLPECIPISDLVFECVSEDLNIKKDINAIIAAYATEKTIIATVTSGLSINSLSEMFPTHLKSNYLGLHFFNPPYNMPLCEVIPSAYTNKELLKQIKIYLKNVLYRTVVEIKDAPAFLGNRIGFQFINEATQYAERYKDSGGIDYIDAILGQFTGRNMAPILTADFVGLDTLKAIVDNLYLNTNDYANETFKLPDFAAKLISEGKLGRKVGEGFYKTIKRDGIKEYYVYDIVSGEYRPIIAFQFPFASKIIDNFRNGDYTEAIHTLIINKSAESQICLSFLIKYVIYSIYSASIVADSLSAADDVMATGFNWIPPLALIDAFGGKDKFYTLALEREPVLAVNIHDKINYVFSSAYDYRRYFKAKK